MSVIISAFPESGFPLPRVTMTELDTGISDDLPSGFHAANAIWFCRVRCFSTQLDYVVATCSHTKNMLPSRNACCVHALGQLADSCRLGYATCVVDQLNAAIALSMCLSAAN